MAMCGTEAAGWAISIHEMGSRGVSAAVGSTVLAAAGDAPFDGAGLAVRGWAARAADGSTAGQGPPWAAAWRVDSSWSTPLSV